MRMVKLGEVAEINPRAERLPTETPVSFVGMAQLDAHTAVATPLDERSYGEVSKGYTQFRNGDVLAAKITPCWENGKVGIAKLDLDHGAGSTEFHVIRADQAIDPRYLLHFLRQKHVRLMGELRMTGSAGQRRVPSNFLANLSIHLPPIEEQRRIAAILDQADAIRTQRRQVINHFASLKLALFEKSFGPNTATSPHRALGDIITGIESGSSPKCEARPAAPDEWGILKLSAISYGNYREEENKAFLGDTETMIRHEVRPGDVLMSRKNTRELVGAVSLVGATRPRLLLPDLIYRLHLNQFIIDPVYFQAMMMSPTCREKVRSLAGGAAASMSNISRKRLEALPVPVPSLDRQQSFANEVRSIERITSSVQQVQKSDDALFASLQSRAFTGEL